MPHARDLSGMAFLCLRERDFSDRGMTGRFLAHLLKSEELGWV
jgi:hypothetical protein